MKKFIIEESEVKRILSMHRVVKEQTTPASTATTAAPAVDPSLQKLRDAFKAGCFSNGKIYLNKTKNLYYFRGVKQSTKQEVDFFPDMTYSFVDGTKKGKWDCAKIATAQANAKTAQETQTSSQINIERTKKEGNWKERKDITDTDANVNNPQMYEKQVVNGETLYRRISGKGIAGALDDRQQTVVTKWEKQGAKLEKDVDSEQAKTWSRKLVSPKSDGLFSEDFYMYFPPNTVNNAAILTAFKSAVTDQTANSKPDCKAAIEAYYSAFKVKAKIEPNTMDAMKEKVQACVNQFKGKWGIGAFTKIDNYVDILTGVERGGPSSYGNDAKWRLN